MNRDFSKKGKGQGDIFYDETNQGPLILQCWPENDVTKEI